MQPACLSSRSPFPSPIPKTRHRRPFGAETRIPQPLKPPENLLSGASNPSQSHRARGKETGLPSRNSIAFAHARIWKLGSAGFPHEEIGVRIGDSAVDRSPTAPFRGCSGAKVPQPSPPPRRTTASAPWLVPGCHRRHDGTSETGFRVCYIRGRMYECLASLMRVDMKLSTHKPPYLVGNVPGPVRPHGVPVPVRLLQCFSPHLDPGRTWPR